VGAKSVPTVILRLPLFGGRRIPVVSSKGHPANVPYELRGPFVVPKSGTPQGDRTSSNPSP
jgi:hypothetical protein